MNEEKREPIDVIIGDLKEAAKRLNHRPDWDRLEANLRAFVAELSLLSETTFRTEKGCTFRRVGAVTASVTEARELLGTAKKSAAAARSLPVLLSKFAETTYGNPGLMLIPRLASKIYVLGLDELDACLVTYEEMLKKTIARAGNVKGAKGPLLEKIIDTPRVRFLRRLIPWWREATGRTRLGETFQELAKKLIEITLPHDAEGRLAEIGDLKRQIENAKRRGPLVLNEWRLLTDLMNEQS
jgi:hypothetical protein